MNSVPSIKMRPKDAATYMGFSASTLAKMRLRGDGPPYTKAGARIVIYDQAELDKWLAENRRRSTSDDGTWFQDNEPAEG